MTVTIDKYFFLNHVYTAQERMNEENEYETKLTKLENTGYCMMWETLHLRC